MDNPKVQENNEGIIFTVKVVPGSSKTSLAGILDGMLKVKVAAPPEKGKANAALIDLLSKKLKLKKNSIKITTGATSPVKTILAEDITKDDFLSRLSLKE